ncbi:MAG TPA: glutamyl-tRNA reductase [Dehalococcoidia bacterium]|jgi:glutamyl-tRNA reductase|nr:glutamyl-tRNA reductase [Dehalococcoidia bacterium]
MAGTSHHIAPLDVRERLTVTSDELPELLASIKRCFGAGAVISTCNRFEVYLPGSYDREGLLEFLIEEGGADAELAPRYFEFRQDDDAISHIYEVATGLDSMVLGESEILGQVRSAFSATVAAGADNSLLSRLFHTAIRVGRRARSETEIGHHALSISYVAAHQARELAAVEDATVLVVGAGDAGRHAAESLSERGVGRVLVTNRTAERAQTLADDLGGEAVPFEQLSDALSTSDVILAASDSHDHLVSRDQMAEAMSRRDSSPVTVIDIGLPRDFDPAVRDIPGVTYRDLDDLQAVVADHMKAREAEVSDVRVIVAEETQNFIEWWEQLQVVPTIAALTERADLLRQRELEKSLRRMDLNAEQTEQLNALTRAVVKQILHDPIKTLRERGDRDVYVDAVRTLFHLDDSSSNGTAPAGDA